MGRKRSALQRPIASFAKVQSWVGNLLRNRRFQLRSKRITQRHLTGDCGETIPFQDQESLQGDFTAMLSVNRVFYQDRNSPHGHRTMFDFALLDLSLRRAGFASVARARSREGRDPVLLIDSEARVIESLHVEALAPGKLAG